MTKGNFYFIADEYFEKYKDKGVMNNKEVLCGEEKGRPCYYAFPDEDDPEIYWMIPISSKVEKYKRQYDYSVSKYGICDGIVFGYVRGRKAAFLLQNICPVTKRFVIEEYVDCVTKLPISIPNDIKRKLNAHARKIIRYAKRGKKICITDIMHILNDLKCEQEKQ